MNQLQVSQKKVFKQQEYEVIENLIVRDEDKIKMLKRINILSIIILFGTVIIGGFTIALLHSDVMFEFELLHILLFFAAFVAFIFVHEAVHGLAYKLAGNISWKDLSYGAVVKSGMAYCIAGVPVSVKASRISLWAPFVVLCLPVIIYSIIAGDMGLLFAGALFASGSSGDFWYLWKLRKKSKDLYMIEEKPEAGYYQLGFYLLKLVEQ